MWQNNSSAGHHCRWVIVTRQPVPVVAQIKFLNVKPRKLLWIWNKIFGYRSPVWTELGSLNKNSKEWVINSRTTICKWRKRNFYSRMGERSWLSIMQRRRCCVGHAFSVSFAVILDQPKGPGRHLCQMLQKIQGLCNASIVIMILKNSLCVLTRYQSNDNPIINCRMK